MFGSYRDVATFKLFTKELMEEIISQEIGYYKTSLADSVPNVYGETPKRYFSGPVLIPCMIDRGDFNMAEFDQTVDSVRDVKFRFFKDHLVEANVVPEVGDIIMYNEDYYEVSNVNENQLILGKNPDYTYSNGTENFGQSYSIILETHYSSPDRLGITKERL
mgnify:FL=1